MHPPFPTPISHVQMLVKPIPSVHPTLTTTTTTIHILRVDIIPIDATQRAPSRPSRTLQMHVITLPRTLWSVHSHPLRRELGMRQNGW